MKKMKMSKNSLLQAGTGIERTSEEIPILILNDDCLLKICGYLPFLDQIEFAYVCKRFRQIANEFFKKDDVLDFEKVEYSTDKLLKIVKVVGPFKKCFKHRYNDDGVDSIIESCPNLQHINLYHVYLKSKIFKDTNGTFKMLKTLIMESCKITDHELSYLKGNKYLEILNIKNNREVTGVNLRGLENVRELIISGTGITSKNFIAFCKEAKNLKTLDISLCSKITDEAIDYLIEKHGKCLESLNIDDFQMALFQIDGCTALKSLSVCAAEDEGYKIPNSFLDGLLKIHLEKISLDYGDIDDEVANYLIQMHSLKSLSLQGCISFGKFILDILSHSNLNLTYINVSESLLYDRHVIEYVLKKKDVLEEIVLQACRNLSEEFLASLLKELRGVNRKKKLIVNVINTITYPPEGLDDINDLSPLDVIYN